MCGLVLVVTKNQNGFNAKQNDVFESLLFMDTLRGEDSTGTFVVDNIGNVKIAKEASQGPVFLATPEYSELRSDAFQRGWAMVGHNRKATKGSINDANAHPFVVDDNIVLVHNGTFHGDHRKIADTEVDSEAIAHALNNEDNIETALREINAAYALIWYNVRERKLHVIRNLMRPLWYLETHDSYIFASEKAFLNFVIDRHQLTPKSGPYEFKEYNLFTLTLNANKSMTTTNEELDCSYYKHHPFQSTQTTTAAAASAFTNARACGYEDLSDDLDFWIAGANRDATEEVEDVIPRMVEIGPVEKTTAGKPSSVPPSLVNKLITRVDNPRSMTYKSWFTMKDEYPEGQKLKVIVDDLTEADDDPKTHNFMMIGRTLDQNHAYVMFPFTESDFTKVVALANEGVFEVEVNGHAWRRTEPADTKKPNIQDWQGVAVINAVNPKAIYTQEASSNAS